MGVGIVAMICRIASTPSMPGSSRSMVMSSGRTRGSSPSSSSAQVATITTSST
jgi:hypothetical protein